MLWTPYPRTPSETSDDDDMVAPDPGAAFTAAATKAQQHLHSSNGTTGQSTRFARLTRPLSFMDKRKSHYAVYTTDTHLYPEPIRYYGSQQHPNATHYRSSQYVHPTWLPPATLSTPHSLSTFAANANMDASLATAATSTPSAASGAGPAFRSGIYRQQRTSSAQLPSYELVEQERLHHSLNSIATATVTPQADAAGRATTAAANVTGSGIYFIAPYGRRCGQQHQLTSGRGVTDGRTGGGTTTNGTMLVNSFTDDFAQYQVRSGFVCDGLDWRGRLLRVLVFMRRRWNSPVKGIRKHGFVCRKIVLAVHCCVCIRTYHKQAISLGCTNRRLKLVHRTQTQRAH